MGRCAAEYCSIEHTKENPGHRIPVKDIERFKEWFHRMGRGNKNDKEIPESWWRTQMKMQHRVCDAHIHEGGLKRSKGGLLLLTKDAQVMTLNEHKRKLAEAKLELQHKEDAKLVERLEMLDLLKSDDIRKKTTRTKVSELIQHTSGTSTVPHKKVHRPSKEELESDLAAEEKAVAKAVLELCEARKTITQLEETIRDLTSRCSKLDEESTNTDKLVEDKDTHLKSLHETIKQMATTVKDTRVYKLSYEYIIRDAKKVRLWTGFQSIKKFTQFMDNLKCHCEQYKPGHLTVNFEDAILMWFVRVRHNVYEAVIQHLFGVGTVQTVSNILNDANIVLLSYFRHPANAPMNLFTKDIATTMILPCFKDDYPTLATVIDATEFFIETPSNLDFQRATWSSYKHHNTVKMLVAMNAAGHCVYCSPLYPGRISDRDLSLLCVEAFFSKLWPGSSAMGDKGFYIQDLLPEGCEYNVPPMLKKDFQFTEEENEESIRIASSRIHIERVNCRAKTFRMLAQEVRLVDLHFFCIAAEICFYLTDIISPCVRTD